MTDATHYEITGCPIKARLELIHCLLKGAEGGGRATERVVRLQCRTGGVIISVRIDPDFIEYDRDKYKVIGQVCGAGGGPRHLDMGATSFEFTDRVIAEFDARVGSGVLRKA